MLSEFTTHKKPCEDTFYERMGASRAWMLVMKYLSLYLVLWSASLAYFRFVWSPLRQRLSYTTVAAVLCLTPVQVGYGYCATWYNYWPLLFSPGAVAALFPDSLGGLLYPTLPAGSVIGVLAFFLYEHWMRLRDGQA